MKRIFWILITPLAVLLLLGTAINQWALPKLEAWALQELHSYSDQKLPLVFQAESLHILFFKPSVMIENISLKMKGELAETFLPLQIKSVRVHLDFFQLLTGRLQLSAVVIENVQGEINLDPLLKSDSSPKPLPLDDIFAMTEKIPLERIFINHILLDLKSQREKAIIRIRDGGLLITNMGKNLTLKTELPQLHANIGELSDIAGSLDAHLYLTRQSLKIIQAGLHLNASEVVARGELTEFKNVTLLPQGMMNVSTNLHLGEIYQEIKRIRPQLKIPRIEGNFQSTSNISFKGLTNLSGNAQVKLEKVSIDKYTIGDAMLRGSLKGDLLKIPEIKILNPAGEARLIDTEIQLDPLIHFKTKFKSSSMDMQKLFVALGMKDVPVSANLSGDLPCQGQLKNALLECTGKLVGTKFWVRSELKNPATEIVGIELMGAEGNVKVDHLGVDYKAQISMGDSHGLSEGRITYAEGFKINFKSDLFDFKNVRNLSGLHLSGTTSLSGDTEGSSAGAIFNMQLGTHNFIFEDFQLGDVAAHLKYVKGVMNFEGIAGLQNRTQYNGAVIVDLSKKQLEGQIKMPTADLADVAKVFERIYKFPVNVSGLGQGNIHFNGPLNFWKMNYQLQSEFKNFTFGPESFDKLTMQASATNGNIKAENIVVQKNTSSLVVTGGISSEKNLNLLAEAKNWRLEESDIISKINNNIFGILNGVAEIKGNIPNANVNLRGSITETVIEEQEIAKSHFSAKIDRSKLDADFNLFGDRIKGNILLPLNSNRSALKVKIATYEWPFSNILAIFGGGSLVNEYDSTITSEINLSSESGDIFKSTGDINISNLTLKRGVNSIKNPVPMQIHMNNGSISFKNFYLEGRRNKIQFKGDNFTRDNLNINVVADIELRLFHLLLPFMEDIGGALRTTASISGSLDSPQILGNLNLNGGFFKIKGFPHPFEKIQSDVSFSHTRILINMIKGQLAGGALNGDGSVMIKGPQDWPVNVRATIDAATMTVPEHVRTTGSAEMLVTGKWFPFTLSGTYKVANAFIDKEFGGGEGTTSNLRKSVYLPKVLSQENFEPLLLDVQVILDKNVVIKNSMADGLINGTIQVKGPAQSPLLFGRINLEKNSRLIFKDKVFEVQTGQVQFTNPNEIDPDIYVSAQSRVSEYDVTLVVQGNAKNLNIHVSSQPPLSDQDIISLLALGVTSTKLDQNVQSKDQQAQTSYEIGAAIIGAPINRQLESTLGLNFQFSSSFDSTRNVNIPKVTLSKKLSKRLNASASRMVGSQNDYDVKLQYLINQNVSAIGSFEKKDSQGTSIRINEQDSRSFFGLDLEFKREFK